MSPVDSEEGGEIRGPCVSSPCVFLSGAPRDSSVLRGPSWRAGFDDFGFDSSIPSYSTTFHLSLFFSPFLDSRFLKTLHHDQSNSFFQFVIENCYLRYPRFAIRGTRVERSSSRSSRRKKNRLLSVFDWERYRVDRYRRRWKRTLFFFLVC